MLSPAGVARIILDDLVTTVFPADCRACGAPLLRAGNVPVCDTCLAAPSLQTRSLCRRCGEAVGASIGLEDLRFSAMLPEGLLCTPCRLAPPAFTRAVAFSEYRDETRTLIHLLKYEGVRGVATRLAPMLASAILTLHGEASSELLVVAVPLFPAKQRQRGYNQSVLLADAALREIARSQPGWHLTPAHPLLQRVRATEDQYTLSTKGRRRNLRGAFLVTDPELVADREVLLIDDILTTGSTARECARVLIRASASRVWVATVARAQVTSTASFANEFAADSAVWDAAPPRTPTSFGSAPKLNPIAPTTRTSTFNS